MSSPVLAPAGPVDHSSTSDSPLEFAPSQRHRITRRKLAGHAILGGPDQDIATGAGGDAEFGLVAEIDAVAHRAAEMEGRAAEAGSDGGVGQRPRPQADRLGPQRDHAAAADGKRPALAARRRRQDEAGRSAQGRALGAQGRDLADEEIQLADKIGDVAIDRRIIEPAGAAELLDAAVAHDGNGVAHRQRLLLVVGHQDEGDADLALQILQLDLHVAAQLAVERCQRLVEQQHRRAVDERAGDRDPLLLAARQLPDPPAPHAGQPHQLQGGVRPSLDLAAVEPGPALPQAKADILGDGHVGEQRIVLEHHVDRPAIGGNADHRLAGDGDLALVGLLEPGDQPQRGGLAAARRAEEGMERAARNLEGHRVDRGDLAESLRHTVKAHVDGAGGCLLFCHWVSLSRRPD